MGRWICRLSGVALAVFHPAFCCVISRCDRSTFCIHRFHWAANIIRVSWCCTCCVQLHLQLVPSINVLVGHAALEMVGELYAIFGQLEKRKSWIHFDCRNTWNHVFWLWLQRATKQAFRLFVERMDCCIFALKGLCSHNWWYTGRLWSIFVDGLN